jgi:hypothetical protein
MCRVLPPARSGRWKMNAGYVELDGNKIEDVRIRNDKCGGAGLDPAGGTGVGSWRRCLAAAIMLDLQAHTRHALSRGLAS